MLRVGVGGVCKKPGLVLGIRCAVLLLLEQKHVALHRISQTEAHHLPITALAIVLYAGKYVSLRVGHP